MPTRSRTLGRTPGLRFAEYFGAWVLIFLAVAFLASEQNAADWFRLAVLTLAGVVVVQEIDFCVKYQRDINARTTAWSLWAMAYAYIVLIAPAVALVAQNFGEAIQWPSIVLGASLIGAEAQMLGFHRMYAKQGDE